MAPALEWTRQPAPLKMKADTISELMACTISSQNFRGSVNPTKHSLVSYTPYLMRVCVKILMWSRHCMVSLSLSLSLLCTEEGRECSSSGGSVVLQFKGGYGTPVRGGVCCAPVLGGL